MILMTSLISVLPYSSNVAIRVNKDTSYLLRQVFPLPSPHSSVGLLEPADIST